MSGDVPSLGLDSDVHKSKWVCGQKCKLDAFFYESVLRDIHITRLYLQRVYARYLRSAWPISNICLLDRCWDNCQLLHICKQHVSRYACRSTIWIYIHMNTEIYVYKAVVRVVCPKGWVSGVYVVNDFAGRWQYKRIERRDHPVSLHMEVISTAGTESNSTSVISFLLLFLFSTSLFFYYSCCSVLLYCNWSDEVYHHLPLLYCYCLTVNKSCLLEPSAGLVTFFPMLWLLHIFLTW